MQRHREPFAAMVAAVAVFVGIVAPSLMLVVAVSLTAAGLGVLVLGARTARQTSERRGVQNPH